MASDYPFFELLLMLMTYFASVKFSFPLIDDELKKKWINDLILACTDEFNSFFILVLPALMRFISLLTVITVVIIATLQTTLFNSAIVVLLVLSFYSKERSWKENLLLLFASLIVLAEYFRQLLQIEFI